MSRFAYVLLLLLGALLISEVAEARRQRRNAAKVDDPNYYKVLGVSRSDSIKSIKSAWRKKSRDNHPDKGGDHDTYVSINQAWDVLGDEEKRKAYDRCGVECVQEHVARKQQGGGGGGGFFDGFFGNGRRRDDSEKRGADLKMKLFVSLEDLYNGKEFEVSVKNQQLCPKCFGSGARSEEDVHTCHECNGQGVRVRRMQIAPGFFQQVQEPCPVCGGKGKVIKHHCHVCSGRKVVTGDKTIWVEVEPGMPDGHLLTFENEGDEQPEISAGHVIYEIATIAHKHFRREGDHLHMDMTIPLEQALVGFETKFNHLDGHEVTVNRREVTHPGQIVVVAEEGMPSFVNLGAKGNLYLHFSIQFPHRLTDRQKALVRDLNL